jgi:hypothetical protein
MDWLSLALAFVKLAGTLASWARERGQLQAGADAALGKAALGVLEQTQWGKEIAEKIHAMDKAALDDLADALGADDHG